MLKTRNCSVLFASRRLELSSSNSSSINNNNTCLSGRRLQQTKAAAKETVIEEWQQARRFDEIPKYSVFKLIRGVLPGGKFQNADLTQLVLTMREEMGDIYMIPALMGRPAMLTTHNPFDFERVLRNEGTWPHRPGSEPLQYHREKLRADFFQGVEGLISTQGKSWGHFRSIVNPVLMQPKNVRLYYNKMSQVNREFVERIISLRNPETLEVSDDFEDYINRWTLESVSVVALDKQLGLLKDNTENPDASLLFKSINEFFEYSAELELKPSPWRYISTPKFKKLMTAFDNIKNVTSGFVNEAIERLEDEEKRGIVRDEQQQSVLEKLLKIDKKVAIVMAMDMLMAGVDTTTSTFAGIMLCLAKNPDKQAKLREEVMRILPHKDSEFTEESMKNVPYLRAFIKESLRIYPLVIGMARAVERDCILSGYHVPAGTFVSLVPLSSLRNEKYFARPNEFLPERWLRPSDETKSASEANKCPATNELKATNPFVYLPFGFGPRMCVGKRIVDLELELGIARIIRNFHVEYHYPTENAFKTVLLNMPNIPLKFKFIDVKDH